MHAIRGVVMSAWQRAFALACLPVRSGPAAARPAARPAPGKAIVLLFLLLLSAAAQAQEAVRNISSEYATIVTEGNTVGTLGDSLFGDTTSLYTGETNFRQVDIHLPGNNALPVEFARRLVMAENELQAYDFGALANWEIDLPFLYGTFTRQYGWQGATRGNTRCSGSESPKTTRDFVVTDFWHGYHMHVPEAGDRELLAPIAGTSPAGPANGGPWRWLTKDFWFVSCVPSLKNASAYPGEGFVAVSPDGIKVTFDYMVVRDATTVSRPAPPNCMHTVFWDPNMHGDTPYSRATWSPDYYGANLGAMASVPCPDFLLQRSAVRIYATRVEDRFGNWVAYQWADDRLNTISSSDGRMITLGYDGNGRVARATTGTSVWRYGYAGGLVSVTLPDNSAWQFSGGGVPVIEHSYEVMPQADNNNCLWPGYAGYDVDVTMTHPSGAVGEFHFVANRIGRTYMPRQCIVQVGTAGYFYYPPYQDVYSIVRKTIRGPAVPERTWTYAYTGEGGTPFSFEGWCTGHPDALHCTPFNVLEVTGPDGGRVAYTVGNKYHDGEGQLQKVQRYSPTGALVAEQTLDYIGNADAQARGFADPVGSSPQIREAFDAEYNRPQKKSTLVQDGVTYVDEITAHDAYAYPLTRVASNSSGAARTETTTYEHNESSWVLGQVESTAINGIESSRVVYDSRAQPVETYAFGLLQQRLTHYPDGTVATVQDALDNTWSYADYRRGIPQRVTFPDATTTSATVNNLGGIDSRTDALGSTWSYGYDAVGRPTSIAPPTGDTVAWNTTTISFLPVAVPEYGVPAGHWRRIEQTGAGRTTTYYDAQWRPVLVLTEDTNNAASRSYRVRRFDLEGREVFASYAVDALTGIDQALAGVRTSYDALGRVVRVERDSELGVLATTTEYLEGGRVKVTDANGHATTTTYQQFDAPGTDSPILLVKPEGVSVGIVRDVFGKPLTITRTGPYAGGTQSLTRRYVYDGNQRLCKTINPESGADLFDYDAAGRLAWSAAGTALTAWACDRGGVPTSAKVTRSYDALGRLLARVTPDGNGNLAYAYEPDGQVRSIVASNPGNATVTTTYGYNKRRLLTIETASQPNRYAWPITYGYNPNGHVVSLKYPGGLTVGYGVDALGRPTSIGAYATGIGYYPNGAIRQFTYGNGIVHTLAQNARGLPARSRDLNAAVAVLDDATTFDANGNVLDITDRVPAQPVIRAMSYDGLDRLTNVVADNLATPAANDALWGIASYTYDALDNLRKATLGLAGFTYGYDAGNRLSVLKRTGGGTYTYVSDARGNVVDTYLTDPAGNPLAEGRRSYTFDGVNRLGAAQGKESYRYDGLGRRAESIRTGSLTLFDYARDGRVLYVHDTRRGLRTSNIYLGDTLLAEVTQPLSGGATTTNYLHTDALGSPVARTDAARTVIERTTYTPYGAPFDHPVDGVGYTGHVNDVDTGLVYAQQRYYDPQVGRFMSVDPARVEASRGVGFNAYVYANDNPYRYFDPDGRRAVDDSPDHLPSAPRPRPQEPAIVSIFPIPPPPKVTYKEGVTPVPDLTDRLQCTAECSGRDLRVTSTNEINREVGHLQNTPHGRGEAVDLTVVGGRVVQEEVLQCMADCGFQFQLNEYANPSSRANGPHLHGQTGPGLRGATGPYFPRPPPPIQPWPAAIDHPDGHP
jgi:RHS repeat-associated protein